MVPKWLVCKVQSGKASLFEFLKSIFEFTLQSMQVTKASADEKQESKRETIYEKLTDPTLPPEERTLARIHDESVVLLQAGTESIGRSLTICAFHLAHQPSIWKKLRDELRPVLPTPTSTTTWAQLEQLPYIVCIISPVRNMTAAADVLRLALCTSASVFPTD